VAVDHSDHRWERAEGLVALVTRNSGKSGRVFCGHFRSHSTHSGFFSFPFGRRHSNNSQIV
jgi:8-oxo-dGTP pyrophosphatase MutT (NUDIX family)